MVAASTPGRVRLVHVRRPGVDRTLTVLDPQTRDRYTSLVAQATERIESQLSPNVLANRVATWSTDPPELRLRPWRAERRAFAGRLLGLAERRALLAFVDVERCYASISARTVGRALLDARVDGAEEIRRFLGELEHAGGRGLPVGPAPSAVLANAVLTTVDRALERAGIEHIRWVDDVVCSVRDPNGALAVIRNALAQIGLRLNERKTRFVRDVSADALDVWSSRTP